MADQQISKGFKNLKYSFVAQAIILAIGIAKALIIPSVLSVDSYAYWQIYLFYIGYVGFCYLGYNDGILLRYGKYDYTDLPFEKLRRSMQFYIAMLLLFSAAICVITLGMEDAQKEFSILAVGLSVLMYGLNGVFIYVFLITNQIKRHSFFSAVDSVSNFLGVLLLVVLKQEDFRLLILFVFITKLLSVLAMMFLCKDIVFGKCAPVAEGFHEFIDNIKVGIFLMLAQIMSMLVTGLGRVFVEYGGELKEYAYYSFGMTVLNIILVGVTAVATVMYPTLGRVDAKLLPTIFNKTYDFFTYFTVVVLFLYYPAYILVGIVFPKYASILGYFFILFLTMTWQAKVTITTNSYFRVLRMERRMFKINAISVGVFLIAYFALDLLFGKIINNLVAIVALSTCISMITLEIMAESQLRRQMGIVSGMNPLKDLGVNLIFAATALIGNIYIGFACYAAFLAVYGFLNRKKIRNNVRLLKEYMKK